MERTLRPHTHIDWQNIKFGKLSVRLFSKLHIMHTLHGMACAAITPGRANDSPHLRLMIETLPEGDGDVLLMWPTKASRTATLSETVAGGPSSTPNPT